MAAQVKRPVLSDWLGAALEIKMGTPYVIQKNGMFYGHNSAGYVTSVYCAELYTEEYAMRQAGHCDECQALPITYFVEDRETAQEYLDRVEAIRDAFPTGA